MIEQIWNKGQTSEYLECRPSVQKFELKFYFEGTWGGISECTYMKKNDRKVRKMLERFIFPSET